MGMVLGFTRVTPEQLGEVMADEDAAMDLIEAAYAEAADKEGGFNGYLDKSWDGIQFLLGRAEVPVSLFFDGEMIGEDGTLFGWSADVVRATAELLRATPFDRLAAHFDPAEMTRTDTYPKVIWERDDDALDYLREHYEVLVRFFAAAAESGSAAIMEFNF